MITPPSPLLDIPQVKAPENLMRYIVPKGFIAVDGTSLTVCEVDNDECWFSFMLVAYTQVGGDIAMHARARALFRNTSRPRGDDAWAPAPETCFVLFFHELNSTFTGSAGGEYISRFFC